MFSVAGKQYDNGNRFALQGVSRLDEMLLIDDVTRSIDFDGEFNMITDVLEIENKREKKIRIPFSESPKIAYTSNFVPKDTSVSMARRVSIVELVPYYSLNFSPENEFDHTFWSDWIQEDSKYECEYHRFVIFCMKCVQDLLSGALKRPTGVASLYPRKQFLSKVNDDDVLLRYFEVKGLPKKSFSHVELTDRINKFKTDKFGSGYSYADIKKQLDELRAGFPMAKIESKRGQYIEGSERPHLYEVTRPEAITLNQIDFEDMELTKESNSEEPKKVIAEDLV